MNSSLLTKITGPISLPLEVDKKVEYHTLYYFEYNKERWASVSYGDIHRDIAVPLRIESACFFGHVFHSRQCDCGFQLTEAFKRIRQEKRGLVIYGIDQDARGLGIESHFKIYDYRQNFNLDTEAVFEKLHAKLDNRDYTAVKEILNFLKLHKIKLLSNNPSRIEFLTKNGFYVEREEIEAPLDRFNMATMMLEKEDLQYQWSFETHAHWLMPIQKKVEDDLNLYAGRIVAQNKNVVAEWVGSDWRVADKLRERFSVEDNPGPCVVYLTDYPRKDELKIYADLNIFLIVMPFSSFPDYLTKEANMHSIKLQDWARENKYDKHRPQWELVNTESQHDIYQRDGSILKVSIE